MNSKRSRQIKYFHVDAQEWQLNETRIVIEQEIPLIVNGKVWMEMLCTPDHLDYLGVGFLFNEGLIKSSEDLVSVSVCESGDYVEIKTTQEIIQPRYFHRTTGCSGGVTAVQLPDQPIPELKNVHLSPDSIYRLIQKFESLQKDYLESRGVHCSALSDGNEILVLLDDVGRHNTLDKLAGYCIVNQISLPQPVVLTTGRISSEMLQKSARIGSSLIISLTSPNNYSIELAEAWGITLVGYSRRNSFNLYTHPERILDNVNADQLKADA